MIVLGRIVIGLGMLTLGRQLFWLFVGGVGFLFGINIAPRLLGDQPDSTMLVFALVIGLIGAVVALVLQQVAVNLAGFIGGGILAVNLVELLALDLGSVLIPFIVGGVIGLILISVLFDWALIVISSFVGASVIVQTVGLERPLDLVILVVLLVFGMAVQSNQMRRSPQAV